MNSSLLVLVLCISVAIQSREHDRRRCRTDLDCKDKRFECRNRRCFIKFPGHHESREYERKAALKLCSTDIDCDAGSVCSDGKCLVNNGLGGLCSSDAYCPSGYVCIDGKCDKSARRRHFFMATAPSWT